MNNKSTQYVFAHNLFPDIIFNNTGVLLRNFFKGEDEFNRFLNNVWNRAGNENMEKPDGRWKDEDLLSFEFYANEMDNNAILCVIKMPFCEEASYTKCVCFLINEDNSIRYFIYEIDRECGTQEKYDVCELTKDGKSIPYGSGEEGALFMDYIRELCYK